MPKTAEFSLLFEISQILDPSLDLREVLAPVLKAMAGYMGMVRGSLTLLNRDTGEISIEAAYGLSASQKRGPLPPRRGGHRARSSRPATRPWSPASRRSRSSSTAPAPAGRGGQDIVLHLRADQAGERGHRRAVHRPARPPEAALQEDVRLLTIIASMIAQAVRCARRRRRSGSGSSRRTCACRRSSRTASARRTSSATPARCRRCTT